MRWTHSDVYTWKDCLNKSESFKFPLNLKKSCTHHLGHSRFQTSSSVWLGQWCLRESGNEVDFCDRTGHFWLELQHPWLTCDLNTQWLCEWPTKKLNGQINEGSNTEIYA